MLDDKKARSISSIEKARTVALQKTADGLVQRGIQDIDRLFADLSESKPTAGQPTQDVKRYDPYARYEIGDVIYKEYDETLNVGSTNVEHFRGGVILKVVGKAFYRAFNCEMLEVDYTGGGIFRKYVDYMKKTRTQILLPSNTEARGLVPDIIGVGVNTRIPERWMLLHNAAFNGDREMAELLIVKGADVNAKLDDGDMPLHLAASKGHKDVAELLVAKGAEVNAKGNDGMTPLHLAIFGGQEAVAELLVAKGADVNAKSRGDFAPLHLAAITGRKNVTNLLIAKGADVNTKTSYSADGVTPLNIAATNGSRDVAELLIAKGADVNAKDYRGLTPLRGAIWGGHKDVVELLKKHGAKE